jgi:hypothetical protein
MIQAPMMKGHKTEISFDGGSYDGGAKDGRVHTMEGPMMGVHTVQVCMMENQRIEGKWWRDKCSRVI